MISRAARDLTPVIGGDLVVSGFAIGDDLDTKDGQSKEQQDVNVAALVKYKCQNYPGEQNQRNDDPHNLVSPAGVHIGINFRSATKKTRGDYAA